MMKNPEWKLFDLRKLQSKNEEERFDIFSESILNDEGDIIFGGQLLQRAASIFPDNVALIYNDRHISYKELYQRSILFSKKLLSHGIKPGDRVLLFIPNSLEFYLAYFGIWQIGAVVAPLNIFLKERELKHIVHDAQPKLIVTLSDRVDLFQDGGLPPILTEKDMNIDGELAEYGEDFHVRCLPPDDLAALLYTSGTTGLPKGVMLSSKNIMKNVVQILARMPLNQSQRIFCVLPLFHSFAQNTCLWSAFFSGCTVVVVPKIGRRAILEGLKHKPTIFLGVPALYGLLCLLRKASFPSVSYFICGGDALPDKIRAAFELVYRRKLCNGYGLTETSPLISVDLEDVFEPTNNVGRPVLGVSCVIKDDKGNNLPEGQIGILWVKGDNIMLGYYNAPEKTEDVLRNGWFCTGDFAMFDRQGKLLICGRDKDLIIHKGLNIYPQEIENVLIGHMAVLYAGVIGVVDETQAEIPVAFVQLHAKEKEDSLERELIDLCKKNLAPYKVPRRVVFVKDMPLTATNKVDKKVLRAQFAEKEDET